jgi:hypothetical protein
LLSFLAGEAAAFTSAMSEWAAMVAQDATALDRHARDPGGCRHRQRRTVLSIKDATASITSDEHEATIDPEDLARDPASAGVREGNNPSRHILGHAPATQWNQAPLVRLDSVGLAF